MKSITIFAWNMAIFFGVANHSLAKPLETMRFDEPLSRIAFGSCNFQLAPQSHWPHIAKQKPELWVWAGDNIYADYHSPSARERQYQLLKNNNAYKKFTEAIPVIGTWDDHDYGSNNIGGSYTHKVASQKLLLDFLGELPNSPRRIQQGIYTSYVLGPPDKQVQIILLDLRFFREKPGANASILGNDQWDWLHSQLQEQNPRFTLIVSSSQFLPHEHKGEKWADYPQERERLLELIQTYRRNTLILSGDRHFAEFSKYEDESFPLYEFTSSGLTHGHMGPVQENSLREQQAYTGKNFGMLSIDWKESSLESIPIEMQIFQTNGKKVSELSIQLSK